MINKKIKKINYYINFSKLFLNEKKTLILYFSIYSGIFLHIIKQKIIIEFFTFKTSKL